MVHTLDPFIWEIFSGFGIRWYGTAYLLGFIAAFYFIRMMSQSGRALMPERLVGDFITYVAIGTMVGGRLGYVLFYSPDLLTSFGPEFPFWGLLAVNKGGMASHGGIIGIIVACYYFSKVHKIEWIHLLDLTAVIGPLGVFFGRIANFINGELVGRPAPEDLKWAVKFPVDMYSWTTEATEKLPLLAEAVNKLGVSRETWLNWAGSVKTNGEAKAQVENYIEQLILATQQGRNDIVQLLEPLLTPRHPSQIYAAFGEGLLVFLVLLLLWYKPRKPGVIASTFVCLYAVVRICTEQFRMPDVGIGFQWLGLTRGQWLSIVMLVFGLIMIVFWSKRKSLPISGWGQRFK